MVSVYVRVNAMKISEFSIVRVNTDLGQAPKSMLILSTVRMLS